MKKIIVGLFLAASFILAPAAFGQITNSTNYVVNLPIPDDDIVGITSSEMFVSDIQSINQVSVTLNIAGGFNGDLYAYLTYESAFCVLLNRVGRMATNVFGYPDSGFNVSLTDFALNDIHTYRNQSNPNGGVINGTWQPDGRSNPPGSAFDTSLRDTTLGDFTGLNPNGQWTLFIADRSALGEATLVNWSLDIIGVVPEPSTWALLVCGGAIVLARRTLVGNRRRAG